MKTISKTLCLATITILPFSSFADVLVVKDDFTVSAAQNSWTASGGACLTAGNDQPFATGISVIPSCPSKGANKDGGATGTLPDASGKGALRLTNNSGFQSGSIVYNANFPTNQGIQATFTTFTYNGDSGGDKKLGADGMSFFLLDGSLAKPAAVGATGGSLGYSCSNVNGGGDGITGGYIGLGMDEYGNFSTGVGDSTATGGPKGYAPNSIVLRGGGSINSAYLQSIGAPSGAGNVHDLCRTGSVTVGATTYKPLNYPYITGTTLPVNVPAQTGDIPLAQSTTQLRPDAVPVTYKLKITPSGLLSLWYSYNGGTYTNVIADRNIIDPTVSGPLPSSFRFGFSGGTGGSTNIHELTCFIATPANVSASSGAINTINGAQVQVGTQVYLAKYHPDNWWGQLTANPIVKVAGIPTISTNANWDGSCNLTGGVCDALGKDGSGNAKTVTKQTTRVILTSNGSGGGIPFTWDSLSTSQQTALNKNAKNVADTNGQIRLNYLRGNRVEERPLKSLRERTSVLGDIIDSSPAWVGPASRSYPTTWSDRLYPSQTNSETSYAAFITSTATRSNIVYVGSNDGMIHGFRAGNYNTDGTYNTTSNDGQDVLSYVPANIISNLPAYTDPEYSHNFYVNAIPASGDLFYNNSWHTWLVGGLGAGGKAIFALDVTDPTQFIENDVKAANVVIGEWTDANLTELGNTYGTPIIRRLHNGQWAVIFGNGYNSANGKAGIYIMTVDSANGSKTFRFLATGNGTTAAPNGIANVVSADLDGDRIADYLYAGDLLGNVWRFDVTSSNPADWAVSKFNGTTGTPLFTAKDASNKAQPITTQMQVTAVPVGTSTRVLLMFATGRKIPFTTNSGDTYATGTQSVYGVWDWDMQGWSNGMTTASSVAIPASGVPYAFLTGTQTIARTDLTTQTTTSVSGTVGGQVLGYRTLSDNKVCWKGSIVCGTSASGNTKYGWKVDLPLTGEQVIYNPVLADGALELNTTIPPSTGSTSCTIPVPTGWTMAFNPLTGGTFANSYFPDGTNQSIIMGNQLNAAGSPGTTSVDGDKYVFGPNTSGDPVIVKKTPPSNVIGKRITWKQTQ